MDRLLFTAVSGASHSLMQQQISANNLANANTTGFRADIALSQSEAVRGLGFATRVMVQPQTSGVDASSAAAERTGRPLDVAI